MTSTLQEQAENSLERIQQFNVEQLPRTAELGSSFHFEGAVQPARRLIDLYQQLPKTALRYLPHDFLQRIKNQADADFQRLNQLLEFDPSTETNPTQVRDGYVNEMESAYQQAFQTLHPSIAYGVSRAVDFQRLENDARAVVQSIRDEAADLTTQLEQSKNEATKTLEEVRKVAAEQGVSQQAIYFKDESEEHQRLSDKWQKWTMWFASGLTGYAIASLFIHKIPILAPSTTYEAAQLVASKFLIFGVLSYLLFLASKNFLSHKHNAIVNKHRQNALMTFTALADAAGREESRDVVLSHAAASIFLHQDTGYSKSGGQGANGVAGHSLIEIMPKAVAHGSE
ncbi:MAG: hypothetical protein ABJF88_06720 [Rhodothermales bacterium]